MKTKKATKKKRWLASIVTAIMVVNMLNIPAFAAETTNLPDDATAVTTTCNCTALCTEESRNLDCPVCGIEGTDLSLCMQAAANFEQEEDSGEETDESMTEEGAAGEGEAMPEEPTKEPLDGYCNVLSLDGNTYSIPVPETAEMIPVESLLKGDTDADKKMYVTVRDDWNRVISTTDPEEKQDSYYQNGGTVQLGQTMKVMLYFPSLKEAAMEGGISEDVYYYLDLPKELIPDDGDDPDAGLLNPAEPMELFHDGTIRAFGGIYDNTDEGDKEAKPWRLKFNFVNTEDQVDISAYFQYMAKINPSLEHNTSYDGVNFGGAGNIAFKTEEEQVAVGSSYKLNITNVWHETQSSSYNTKDTKIDWTVNLTDNTEDAAGNPAPSIAKTLTLDMSNSGGHGYVNNVSGHCSSSNPPFSITVVYSDGTEKTLNSRTDGGSPADWVFYDTDQNQWVARIGIDPNSYEEKGSYSFIAKKLLVTLGKPDGTPVKDVKEWKIGFISQIYDNVKLSGTAYLVNGTLEGAMDDGSDLTSTGGTGRGYGSMGVGAGSVSTSSDRSLGYLPKKVTTDINIYQSGYGGNYFAFHYTPNMSNGLGANYYVCPYAAYYRATLGEDNGLLDNIRIGGKNITWESINKGGTSFNAERFLNGDYDDPVLASQLKKIFPNTYTSLTVFKSSQTNSNGKYYWVVIDKEFAESAQNPKITGWWGYSKAEDVKDYVGFSNGYSTAYTRKPGDWKIYFFNTAGEDISFTLEERLGEFTGTDVNDGGGITNQLEVDYGYDKYQTTCGWGNSKSKVISMEAEYVTAEDTSKKSLYDNWIKWTAEVDFSPEGENYDDRFCRIYMKLPQNVNFKSVRYDVDIEGKSSSCVGNCLYYKTNYKYAPSSWEILTSMLTKVDVNSSEADQVWKQSGLTKEGGYDLYYWDYGSLTYDGKLDGSKKIHLMFFTQVDEDCFYSNGSRVDQIRCDLAVHSFAGDLGNGTGNSLPAFIATTWAAAPLPVLNKGSYSIGQAQGPDDLHQTKLNWYLDEEIQGSYDGTHSTYLNGVWSITDSMKESTVADSDGKQITTIKPGEYVALEKLNVNVSHYNASSATYKFTKEKIEAAMRDGSVTIGPENHNPNQSATLIYAGNMNDGFTLRLKGLKNSTHVRVEYETVLDDATLCKAINPDDPTASYNVKLKNNAKKGWCETQQTTVSDFYTREIVAALNIVKKVLQVQKPYGTGLERLSTGWDGVTRQYTVEAKVGASPTPYLDLTDYISQYKDEGKNQVIKDPAALSALVQSLDLEKLKITKYSLENKYFGTVIYEDGAFTEEWEGSALTVASELTEAEKEDYPGALYHLYLKKKDGTNILAGSIFKISYDAKLNVDKDLGGGKTFRSADYYSGGAMFITNNVRAERAYTGIDQVPTTTETKTKTKAKAKESHVLVCDAGSGVDAEFLRHKELIKTVINETNGDHYEFMVAERAEQATKADPVIHIDDVMYAFSNEANRKALMEKAGMTEEQAILHLARLDTLFRKYLTVSNLKLFDDDPESTPIYEQIGKVKAAETVLGDGRSVKVETPEGKLFSAEVKPIKYDDIVVFTYAVDVSDLFGFYNEAMKEGLLINGLLPGGSQPEMEIRNVASDKNISSDSSEGKVEIYNLTTEKEVTSKPEDGTAHWQIKASTGYAEGESLTLHDEVKTEVNQGDAGKAAAIAEIVKASTRLTNIKLVLEGETPLTIYEDGQVTEAASEAGWTEQNVQISVNSFSIDARIQNGVDQSLLDREQTYLLTYDTILDKEAYLMKLVEQGFTMADTQYMLKNTVAAKKGDSETSSQAQTTHKPTYPIGAKKTGVRDEKDPCVLNWNLTAKTGDVMRTNFEIRDTLQIAASSHLTTNAKKRIMENTTISEMKITLQHGESEAETIFFLDKEGEVINRLEEYGAVLQFDQGDTYGFTLTFDKLAKDTEVAVTYQTTLDKDGYLEAGGMTNTVGAFTNSVKVTAADGSVATGSSNGSVVVTELMDKYGQKAGKSRDGNDYIKWFIPVDLRAEYTTAQLKDAEVYIIDDLNAGLTYVEGSVVVYQRLEQYGELMRGNRLSADQYVFTWDEEKNQIKVQLLHPERYPAVEIEFKTEAKTSLKNLVNIARLKVNGESHNKAADPVKDISASGQTGYITSLTAPEWEPKAIKYLDGQLCKEAGKFSFTLTEVDADGKPLANDAYTETATNDGEGMVTFPSIKYALPKDGEVHYYKLTENDCDKAYKKDNTKYLVTVFLQKMTDGYQVNISYMSSEDMERFSTVPEFHNSSYVNVSGEKIWKDGGNRDGKRPEKITINLLKNGEKIDSCQVSARGDSAWSFGNLPKYDGMTENAYTVTEEAVEFYSTDIAGSAEEGFKITNSYTPSQTSLTVTKVWEDDGNRDGIRPNTVTVKLLADGTDTGKSLVLSKENNWSGTFSGLSEYAAGAKVAYTVEEAIEGSADGETGYTPSAVYDPETNSVVITNSHIPEKVTISGVKVWNGYGKRPEGVTVRLLKNGQEISSCVVTETAEWKWAFEDLPKYENGKKIEYTVTEDAVEGYITKITGSMEAGFTITNTSTTTPGSESEPTSAVVSLMAEKILDGKVPADGAYTFLLQKEDGGVVETKKNQGGTVSFSDLTFSQIGTYRYTISEQAGGNADIIYDDAVYTVIIKVTRGGSGYEAEVSIEKDGAAYAGTPIFVNTTKKPDKPDETDKPDKPQKPGKPGNPNKPMVPDDPMAPDQSNGSNNPFKAEAVTDGTPKTGDEANLALWMTLLSLSGAGMITTAAIIGRRRNRKEKKGY